MARDRNGNDNNNNNNNYIVFTSFGVLVGLFTTIFHRSGVAKGREYQFDNGVCFFPIFFPKDFFSGDMPRPKDEFSLFFK